MKSFQKNKRFKQIMQSKIFLIFLAITIFVFLFSIFSVMTKMEETIKNRKIAEEKITELEQSKEKLNSDIIKLNTENGIEESIREKFGLAKEGEEMIMIVDEKNSENSSKETNSNSFLDVMKSWFK